MRPTQISGQIVKDALTRFPNTPTRTLASKLYKENPAVFTDFEAVRALIRYYRGQRGADQRGKLACKEFIKDDSPVNPFDDLPEGLTDYKDWSVCEVNNSSILCIADTHIPYHNKQALALALQYGKDMGIDCIVWLGDLADFYSVSFWCKDPRRRSFKDERDATLKVLDIVRNAFPSIRIIYKLGNHEERWERYMRVKAPELIDCEIVDFKSLIKADSFNMEVVADRRLIRVGRFLYLVHGHEFGESFFSPVNPARGLFLRGKANALCAHYHQTSSHTESSMDGTLVSCYSIGMLCDMHPEYKPINKWNLGFALIKSDDDGQFLVDNKKIIKGKIY